MSATAAATPMVRCVRCGKDVLEDDLAAAVICIVSKPCCHDPDGAVLSGLQFDDVGLWLGRVEMFRLAQLGEVVGQRCSVRAASERGGPGQAGHIVGAPDIGRAVVAAQRSE